MEPLFFEVLWRSVTSAVLILLVILCRRALRKAPRWLLCLLWLPVGIRLVLPVPIENPIGLFPGSLRLYEAERVQKTEKAQETERTQETQRTQEAEKIQKTEKKAQNIGENAGYEAERLDAAAGNEGGKGQQGVNPAAQTPLSPEQQKSASEKQAESFREGEPGEAKNTVWNRLILVWLAGAAGAVLYFCISLLSIRYRLRNAKRDTVYGREVYFSDRVSSPFLYGMITPKIYLPVSVSEKDLPFVLAHEEAHVRRRDYLIKPVSFLIASVYWFSPFVWVAYVLLCRDLELACDERVVASFDVTEKKKYSEALLHIASSEGRTEGTLAFSELGVKERIQRVLSYQKNGKRVTVLGIILCVTMTACFAGEKQADKPQTTGQNIQEAVPNQPTPVNQEEPGEQEPVLITNIDLTGDGKSDSIFVKEMTESGEMKGIYATSRSESGEVSLEIPENITLSCYQKSKTEFRISLGNLSLGMTTLAEEPAYGVLGKYLEKTLGMKKSGDLYTIEVDCDTFSFIKAENHKGTALLCKGKIAVEEQLLEVKWTLEYSLGEWLITSAELPLWNMTGTAPGWEPARAVWSELVKGRRYIGYLDESSLFGRDNPALDYDGDGLNDRIWREISEGKESYTIHFGNGEELLITENAAGDWIDSYLWQITEEKTVFCFQEAGMSTGGDWMKLHLFEQTKPGLKRMELPEGPALKAEAVSEREIAFYWKEHETVGTLLLDSVSCFTRFTTDEWLEEYTSEENGEFILALRGYDTYIMTDGSVPERKAIQWDTRLGDKWGYAIFTWTTEYVNEEWQITSVFLK